MKSAATRITRFESKPERAFAIAELTSVYAKHARHVERGIALSDRDRTVKKTRDWTKSGKRHSR